MSLEIHKETVYTLSDDQLTDANVQGASEDHPVVVTIVYGSIRIVIRS